MNTETAQPQPIQPHPFSTSALRDAAWTLLVHSTSLTFVVLLTLLLKKLQSFSATRMHSLVRSIEQDVRVCVLLNLMLERTQASRVLLAQFHNGESLSSGKHFMRISVTHEATAPGVAPLSKYLQNMPLSRLASEIDVLVKSKVLYISDHEGLAVRCRQYLRRFGIAHIVQFLVSDGNRPIGVLAFHYNHPSPPPEIDHKQVEMWVLDLCDAIRSGDGLLKGLLEALLG